MKRIKQQCPLPIGMRWLIRKCNAQRLLPWTCILQLDKQECINCIGYEHGRVLCLICTRLQMIQRTGTALELTALLRRCSYPKRDVIRWGSIKNGDTTNCKSFATPISFRKRDEETILASQYLSLEDIPSHLSLICPGAFNETLIPGYWSCKAPDTRYWGTIDWKLKNCKLCAVICHT
eukprot:scaffold172629_cov81-Cyclotella_meneghiniana.AAC.1